MVSLCVIYLGRSTNHDERKSDEDDHVWEAFKNFFGIGLTYLIHSPPAHLFIIMLVLGYLPFILVLSKIYQNLDKR
jgi:hypothetical protein